jgi:hypothetical protein
MAGWGPNVLAGGEFEDLNQLVAAGWQQHQHVTPGVSTQVDFAPLQPRSGRFSLRLRAWATSPAAPIPWLETPPVWVTSPPVSVPQDTLVRIHGWVRVSEPISATVDGLLIIDSLGGLALAERIGQSDDWREFIAYRVATAPASVAVTFALSGLGEGQLDQVTISLAPSVARTTRGR